MPVMASGEAKVLAGDLVAALPGRVGDGGAGSDDVRAQAVDLEGRADIGHLEQHLIAQPDVVDERLRIHDPGAEVTLGVGVPPPEALRVGVEGEPSADHLGALRPVVRGRPRR